MKPRTTTALAAASLLATMGLATPAQAAVAVDCSGMINPAGATGYEEETRTLPDRRYIAVKSARINGVQYGYAWVSRSYSGENIWLDVSGDSMANWKQCDLRTLSSTGRNYGQAKKTYASNEVCFRAGYRYGGTTYLTPWWC
uniref:hypothetical protein n=1 Tax=Herbidospora sakaeratensis TaxID=564415 RepID=UPI000780B690|nr:hypothetical protein [Herbidospora sakaeratensis]